MRTVNELITEGINNTHLNILVFGPQVERLSENERIRNLQNKRNEIRNDLESSGHFVRFVEELVDPNLPSPLNNAFLQEIVIMKEYDLIINLVETPGTIAEAALIALKPHLAIKTSLFLDFNYLGGLAAEACNAAKLSGAIFNTYEYPRDLVECHLLTFIRSWVEKAQFIKMVS